MPLLKLARTLTDDFGQALIGVSEVGRHVSLVEATTTASSSMRFSTR